MKKLLLLLLIGLSSFIIVGCDDDDNPSSQNDNSKSATMLINAASNDDWVYFSFESGDSLDVTDPKTSDAWDLAFKRYHLATNSGSSGNAKGGVYNAGKVSMASVTEAPTSGYVVDDSVSIVDHSQNPPAVYNMAASSALAGWIEFDLSQMPPIPSYSDSIYVIKTAKGNYAKIHIKDYYGGDGTKSGMIEFDYVFQPDGSRTFMESN